MMDSQPSFLVSFFAQKFCTIGGNLWNSRRSHLISATTNLDGDAIVMAEKPRPLEQMLDLDQEEPSAEHLDNQVQKAQEQLLQLKRQQEQIEKQKRELEELSRRQDELEHGRGEMSDKLTRALVVLEREAYNAQSRLKQIRVAPQSFAQHF